MDTDLLERIRKTWADRDAGKTRLRDALLSAILEIERCHRDLKDTKPFMEALDSYIERKVDEGVQSQRSQYDD